MPNPDKLIEARNNIYEILLMIKEAKATPLLNTHADSYNSAEINLWAAYSDIENIVENYLEDSV